MLPSSCLLGLQKQLYSPLPLYSAQLLKDDPLLFFPAFLASLPKPPGKLEVIDGMLTVRENGMNYILVNVSLSDDPFKISLQPQISRQITQALTVVESEISGTSILSSGVFRFVAAASAEAQREVSSIGLGSLIGIFILMLLTFRSPRQILVAVLPIVIGILAAFTVSSFVFPKLHLLTLVFGASLIGVSIDYAFHYLVKHRMSTADWNGWLGFESGFFSSHDGADYQYFRLCWILSDSISGIAANRSIFFSRLARSLWNRGLLVSCANEAST